MIIALGHLLYTHVELSYLLHLVSYEEGVSVNCVYHSKSVQ